MIAIVHRLWTGRHHGRNGRSCGTCQHFQQRPGRFGWCLLGGGHTLFAGLCDSHIGSEATPAREVTA